MGPGRGTRAEGGYRINPSDLGPVRGLHRVPPAVTIRRKIAQSADALKLQAAIADQHLTEVTARSPAMGVVLHVDGRGRVCQGIKTTCRCRSGAVFQPRDRAAARVRAGAGRPVVVVRVHERLRSRRALRASQRPGPRC